MMKGKRPKPTEMKRLAGNPGKRPLNDAEPEPAVEIPEPPEELDSMARQEWDRITRELVAVGCVARLYRAPLAAYCTSYSRWVKAEAKVIETGGDICTSKEGGLFFNPWRGVADKALATMLATAEMFGLTPSAKSRVKASAVPQIKSALKVFAAKRGA
jgi:P27 family predicted phage terminase small subunit